MVPSTTTMLKSFALLSATIFRAFCSVRSSGEKAWLMASTWRRVDGDLAAEAQVPGQRGLLRSPSASEMSNSGESTTCKLAARAAVTSRARAYWRGSQRRLAPMPKEKSAEPKTSALSRGVAQAMALTFSNPRAVSTMAIRSMCAQSGPSTCSTISRSRADSTLGTITTSGLTG